MIGPYSAEPDGRISYRGNRLFKPLSDVRKISPNIREFELRVKELNENEMWTHISKINHGINKSVNEYFARIGSIFTLLPLTTKMISSPGTIYGKKAISYTTDTNPITLKWFDLPGEIFLSESSQIYLELSLIQKGIKSVYCIYNSFRKEKADATHLSEFHHIEYEGKVSQQENESIALNLLKQILSDLLGNNYRNLSFFLREEKLNELKILTERLPNITKVAFSEALKILYGDTKNEKYERFTMENNFGSWEEVRITNLLNDLVLIREFPLLEVPFYHAAIKGKEPEVANNADIIWPGYRQVIGSGHRVGSQEELEEKAKIFQLPKEDYEPYLQVRRLPDYIETSGFGLGWERLLQGLLEMPFIWSVSQFPRIDKTIKP